MSAHYCIAIAVNELKAIARPLRATGVSTAPPAAPPSAALAVAVDSPTVLAAAVVHAHEEAVAALRSAGGASPVARSRARSIARSDADIELASSAAAAAVSSGTVAPPPQSPARLTFTSSCAWI